MNRSIVKISDDVTLDFDDIPNLLLLGEIGSGKTYLLDFILVNLFSRLKDDNVEFFGIDPKGLELTGLLNFLGFDCANTGNDILEITRLVESKMMSRYQKLSNHSIEQGYLIDEPPIFLCIDEMIFVKTFITKNVSTATKKREIISEWDNMIERIAVLGRQARVQLFIVSQYLNVQILPLSVSQNLLNRIVLGNAAQQDYIQVFGTGYGNLHGLNKMGMIKSPKYNEPFLFAPYRFNWSNMIDYVKKVKGE